MVNQLIKIEDLEIGDEIITLTHQSKYLKVLETPRKSKLQYSWRPGLDRYISVRCKVNVDITSTKMSKYDRKTKTYAPYTYDIKVYNIKTPKEDSPVEKFDLNFKEIWLVKRNSI